MLIGERNINRDAFKDNEKVESTLIKNDPSQSVKKHACPVVFLTDKYKIIGSIHISVNIRLNDFLLSSSEFIPVTGAVVYDVIDGKELFKVEFISLKKNMINIAMEVQ
jgi:hypothetical protein